MAHFRVPQGEMFRPSLCKWLTAFFHTFDGQVQALGAALQVNWPDSWKAYPLQRFYQHEHQFRWHM